MIWYSSYWVARSEQTSQTREHLWNILNLCLCLYPFQIFQAIILYNQSKALIKYNQANIDWDSYEGYLPVDKKHIRGISVSPSLS